LVLGGDGRLYLVAGSDLIRGESDASKSKTGASSPGAGTLAVSALDAVGSTFAVTAGTGAVVAFAFNEGSGSSTVDVSGNGFNGTLANGAAWTAGKNGNGLSFDGLNGKVSVPNTVDITALPFTVEAWVKPASFADWGAIFSKRSAYSPTAMRFDVGLEISTGRLYVNTFTTFQIFDYSPPLNIWTHVSTVADATGTKLYINGVLEETGGVLTLGTDATAAVAIGNTGDDDDPFSGVIDDFRLYNRALSQTEIQSDMNTPVQLAGPVLDITLPQAGASIIGPTVNVTYTATGDLTEVNHVHFILDTNPVVMDLTFDGVYQFTNVPTGSHVLSGFLVRADHSKINGSDDSVSFTTSVADTIPPTVTLTAPANGTTVSGTLGVTATASDNIGVSSVQFLLDGQLLGAPDTSAPYSTTWNSTTVGNGPHTLAARARDLAGNETTSNSRSVTVSNSGTNPSVVGQWSGVSSWPLVAVHLNLLPNGRLLAWDNSLDHADHTNTAVVWDPVANTFTDVSNPAVNLFCSGQTQLPDGRVIVLGGHTDNDIGVNSVSLFDPSTETWTAKAPMSSARWYPSATTLADGRVLALVGTTTCKDCIASTPEIYDPATDTWQRLTGATSAFARYYPHAFVLPNGKILVAGTSQVANATQYAIPARVLDINTQTWTTVDPATSAEGLSAMYQPGKVVRIGGSWDDGPGFPIAATSVLDMTAASPAWRPTSPMRIPRVLHNLTILPDGSVLVTGGATDASPDPPASSIIYTPELWSPDTETWTTLSDMQTPRLYHSTTALLPDGRVLVTGGGRAFTTDELNAEIFSPPYLFKGSRPTITSAPARANYGSIIFVGTPDGARIAKVSLVRLTSVTHTTNFNQRYVPLTFTPAAGGLSVTLPANGNIAPPGYYLLFIVDTDGVPSAAPIMQIATAPVISNVATSNITSSGARITWTTDKLSNSQVDHGTTSSYGQSSPLDGSLVTAHTVNLSGLAANTTYHFMAKSGDAAGNLGTSSDFTFTTLASADTTPPTAPTGLGATVVSSSRINLAWTASTDNVGVTGYRVERCQGAGCTSFSQIATPAGTSYGDTGLSGNTSYNYRVRAADAAGNLGGYSNVATATTLTPPPATGPVAAYSFNEGSGTTVADASGNGNVGTISNATWTTAGKYGNTLTFNGSSARVTVTDSASLHLTTGMTLEVWVYPTAAPLGWIDLIYKQDDVYFLEASSTLAAAPTAGGTFGNGFQTITGTSELPVNTWTHLAVTFDSATLTVWVNGVSVAAQAQTSPLTTSTLPLQIGGDSLYGQGFAGRIDEVRIYNRALTRPEIEVDMNTAVGSISDAAAPTAPTNLRAFPGGAPASIVTRQGYINSATQTSHTTTAFDSTGGDLVVVFVSSHENVATMTLTDSKANTWISAAGPTNHPSASVDLLSRLWYAKAAKVGTGHTITLNLSTANAAVISVFVIKGSNPAAPLDITSAITNDGGTAGTSITSATITTTQPGDLLLDFAKSSVGVTWTAGATYTFESTASSNYLAAESALAGAAGSYTAGWTMTPATNWHNILTSVVSANASASSSQITMIWNPSTDNTGITGYLIERCAGSGCSSFSQIGSTAGFSTTSYTDTGLSSGTTYTYRIRAKDAAGNLSGYSNTAVATTK
jgi:hypothetical protein